MKSRLGLTSGNYDLPMPGYKGLQKPHSFGWRTIALFFEDELVVRVHCRLPRANLFTNHLIHTYTAVHFAD